MGTTGNYCRYVKALLAPYYGAMTIGGIDLKARESRGLALLNWDWGILGQCWDYTGKMERKWKLQYIAG